MCAYARVRSDFPGKSHWPATALYALMPRPSIRPSQQCPRSLPSSTRVRKISATTSPITRP
ncbi:hypothetical protein [Lysobacter gummosus]|uniref:hypothetical protein n=1 Tax=Lysobacter gummosus TaxID=262324 RepID=UPI003640F17A